MIWPMAPKTKGICEVTRGRIKYASLGDDRERRSHRNDDNMSLLRIGKYVHNGEVIKATMQINDNVTPPSFNHKQRTAHRKLINDTRDIISKYMFHDRIDDVMKWVEMEDIYNATVDSDSESDSDSDSDEDDDDDESSCGSEMAVDDKSNEKQPSKLLPPPLQQQQPRKALVLWDDVFSKANTTYESLNDDWVKDHCDKTEESVKQAMFQMREMGFSITPKIHGLECHLVHQMRTVPGGIAMLIEHWVEQYHQIAAEMDRLWANQPFNTQSVYRVRREHMRSHKGTGIALARIKKSKRGQKRKKADSTVEEKNRIKSDRIEVKGEVQEAMDKAAADTAANGSDTEDDMEDDM